MRGSSSVRSGRSTLQTKRGRRPLRACRRSRVPVSADRLAWDQKTELLLLGLSQVQCNDDCNCQAATRSQKDLGSSFDFFGARGPDNVQQPLGRLGSSVQTRNWQCKEQAKACRLTVLAQTPGGGRSFGEAFNSGRAGVSVLGIGWARNSLAAWQQR